MGARARRHSGRPRARPAVSTGARVRVSKHRLCRAQAQRCRLDLLGHRSGTSVQRYGPTSTLPLVSCSAASPDAGSRARVRHRPTLGAAARSDDINRETAYLLNRFQLEVPLPSTDSSFAGRNWCLLDHNQKVRATGASGASAAATERSRLWLTGSGGGRRLVGRTGQGRRGREPAPPGVRDGPPPAARKRCRGDRAAERRDPAVGVHGDDARVQVLSMGHPRSTDDCWMPLGRHSLGHCVRRHPRGNGGE